MGLKVKITIISLSLIQFIPINFIGAEPISPSAEIGDILYRSDGGQWGPGHAMLFVGHYANNSQKRIVESIPPSGYPVQYNSSISHDIVKTSAEEVLDNVKRRAICDFAISKIGVWVYSSADEMLLGEWKGQSGKCVCHGLTEAAYESVGLNPIPGVDWWTYPVDQCNSSNLADASVLLPSGSVNSPTANTIVRGEISLEDDAVKDWNTGSGIYKVNFYCDETLVGTDQHVCNTESDYDVTWNTTNSMDGQHTIYTCVHDRGGNEKETDTVTIYIDNTKPTVTNTKP